MIHKESQQFHLSHTLRLLLYPNYSLQRFYQFFIISILRKMIENSLYIIIIKTHTGITDTDIKQTKYVKRASVSLKGSRTFPKSVTNLYLLAIIPSAKSETSIRAQRTNINRAERDDNEGLIQIGKKKEIKKSGVSISLAMVILFGTFISIILCIYTYSLNNHYNTMDSEPLQLFFLIMV